MQLSVLRLHFVQLLSQLDTLAGAGGSGHLFFQTFDGSTVARLLLMHIIGTDARNGIRLVAVQVNQALEAIFSYRCQTASRWGASGKSCKWSV